MTTYLLAAAAAGVLLLFAVWLWRRDDPDTDTAELPAVRDDELDWPAEPDPHGWSATARGWDYRQIFNAIVDGYDPTLLEPSIFDDLHVEWVDRLALPTGEYRQLTGATA